MLLPTSSWRSHIRICFQELQPVCCTVYARLSDLQKKNIWICPVLFYLWVFTIGYSMAFVKVQTVAATWWDPIPSQTVLPTSLVESEHGHNDTYIVTKPRNHAFAICTILYLYLAILSICTKVFLRGGKLNGFFWWNLKKLFLPDFWSLVYEPEGGKWKESRGLRTSSAI